MINDKENIKNDLTKLADCVKFFKNYAESELSHVNIWNPIIFEGINLQSGVDEIADILGIPYTVTEKPSGNRDEWAFMYDGVKFFDIVDKDDSLERRLIIAEQRIAELECELAS